MTADNTMGAYLRAARRKRRVSIERAAEETRIRPDFLMRMESDEFDFLAPTYVRGFLRTYARFLGVDPTPLTAEFDRRYGLERTDPSQVIALDRRAQKMPRQRKRVGNWGLAAVLAAAVLLGLAVVGTVTGQSDTPREDEVAFEDETDSPSPTAESATPTPTPTETEGEIAFTEGIDVEIVASNDRCWVDVTADGVKLFGDTIEEGESQTFTAEEDMTIILGNAGGVTLIVNGQDIGAPGGVGEVVTIKLPEDVDSLL